MLPLDYGSYPQHWILFDRIIQQIVLQTESGEDPDGAPINIKVKEIVQLLAKEEELLEARQKAEDLEKDNMEMSNKLAKVRLDQFQSIKVIFNLTQKYAVK